MSARQVRILIVDNDPAMRRVLRGALSAQGYRISEARSGEECLQEATREPADVVLLDVEMPGIGGTEACRRLRAVLPQAGIVMVTVCDTEEQKIRALDAGADDYVTKPFSLRELVARLRAITRRTGIPASDTAILRVGEIELDRARRSLRRTGVEIHLSPTEFALLSFLMQHADIPIEHGRLLRSVWGPEYGSELEYLRTYVKRLRQKIETDAARPDYLLTVPWLGYRFHDPTTTSATGMHATASATD